MNDDPTLLTSNPCTFDPVADTLTIVGVRYSVGLFRTLGLGPTGGTFRIVAREDGVVTLQSIYPADETPQAPSNPQLYKQRGTCPQCDDGRRPCTCGSPMIDPPVDDELGQNLYRLLVRRGYAQHEAIAISQGARLARICTENCIQNGEPSPDCLEHGRSADETFAGIPIKIDPSIPPDTIELRQCPPFDKAMNDRLYALARVLQDEAASDPHFPVRGLANYAAAAERILRVVLAPSKASAPVAHSKSQQKRFDAQMADDSSENGSEVSK